MTIEWEEVGVQHKLIGGSTLGTLMGESSYGGKIQAVYDWIVHGIVGFSGNYATDRGNKYEPVIRDLFVKNTGAVLVQHPGFLTLEDCFAANLDDIAKRGGPLFPVDYKSASNSKSNMSKWGPDGSSKFPKQYGWQLRLYMVMMDRVLGLNVDHGELYTAFGEDVKDPATGRYTGEFKISECRRYFLERDKKLEEDGLAVGRKFWREHIIPKIPPTPPEEKLEMNLSPEDKAFFDMCLGTSPAVPAPAPTPPPVQPPQPVVQPPQTPAANSEDVRASDCVVGTLYKLPGGRIGEFTGTSRENAFFQVGTDPDAAGSSVRIPGASLVQKTKATVTPPAVAPPTEPAKVLAPDVPASIPELAADCPHCPPAKTGKPEQHLVKDCPTLNKAAEPAKEKKPRGRPKMIVDKTGGDDVPPVDAKAVGSNLTTTEPVTMAFILPKGPVVEGIVAKGGLMPEGGVFGPGGAGTGLQGKGSESPANYTTKMSAPDSNGVRSFEKAPALTGADLPARNIILYVNCAPSSGPTPARLEPYVTAVVNGLTKLCGVGDIRSSDDKRLGFGKWRGALADAVRQNLPSGVYQINTADSDFASIVVEALEPFCAVGWPVRGCR